MLSIENLENNIRSKKEYIETLLFGAAYFIGLK